MTDKQRAVAQELEKLLHKRMNKADLEKRLSIIFDRTIEVEDATDWDDSWTGDWYYAFNIYDEEVGGIGGFFDIYFLKMRENDGELDFYITEVTYDFCVI